MACTLGVNLSNITTVISSNAPATTPTIIDITITLANTEQSYAFPANTKQYLMQYRSGGEIKYAFTAGQSGSSFLTIPVSGFQSSSEINTPSLVVYFQSPTAGTVFEVLSWV
jgi:hypothetical protein